MKKLFTLLAIAALLALAIPTRAATAVTNIDYGYVAKQQQHTKCAYVIWPANPLKTIRLVHYDVTNDTAADSIVFFSGTHRTTLTTNSHTRASTFVGATNGFTVGTVVVIQAPDGACQTNLLSAMVATTGLTFTQVPSPGISNGYAIYAMNHSGTNKCLAYPYSTMINTAVRESGQALWAAPLRMPLMIQAYGSADVRINKAVAKYDPD